MLPFTPPCLKNMEKPPTFRLRAITRRDERFYRKMFIEEGVKVHNAEAVRKEVLVGLQALWSPDAFEQHSPRITALWSAQDDFALQRKDDPELVWTYDADEEKAVSDLTRLVAESHPPLRKMMADNANYADMQSIILVALVVSGFSNLNVRSQRERGYLTTDTAEDIQDKLAELDAECGAEAGTAWQELFVACARRMFLDEEEAGNSESPSPSSESPQPSTGKNISARAGKSRASASSKKTRVSA